MTFEEYSRQVKERLSESIFAWWVEFGDLDYEIKESFDAEMSVENCLLSLEQCNAD